MHITHTGHASCHARGLLLGLSPHTHTHILHQYNFHVILHYYVLPACLFCWHIHPLKEGEYHMGLTLALLNNQRVGIKNYLATSFLVGVVLKPLSI